MASQAWYSESVPPASLEGSAPEESCRPAACSLRDGIYGINYWFGPETPASRPQEEYNNKNTDMEYEINDWEKWDEYIIKNQYKNISKIKRKLEVEILPIWVKIKIQIKERAFLILEIRRIRKI